jgi:hypothetical protein
MSETQEAAETAEEQEAVAAEEPVAEAEAEAPAADEAEAPEEEAPEAEAEPEVLETEPEPSDEVDPEVAAAEAELLEEAIPTPVGPAAGRQAKVYLCERGHRTVAVWSTPTTCHARPTRSGDDCGRPLYPIGELPEQVQKALNPLKASKKASKS